MTNADVDEWMAHYGVLGMKWGKRKNADGSPRKTRSELRSLNRESKAKTRTERDASIDAARERVKNIDNTPESKAYAKARADFKTAKKTYREEKNVIGSHAAKRNLGKARVALTLASEKLDKRWEDDVWVASQAKSGKETTTAIVSDLLTVGFTMAAGRTR